MNLFKWLVSAVKVHSWLVVAIPCLVSHQQSECGMARSQSVIAARRVYSSSSQVWVVAGEERIGVFALRDIAADTELTIDYCFNPVAMARSPCYCGEDICSGFMGEKPFYVSRRRGNVRAGVLPTHVHVLTMQKPQCDCVSYGFTEMHPLL